MNYPKGLAVVLLLLLTGCGISVEQKNQAKSHYTLGLSHMQSGSPTMALKELLQAVAIDPQDAEIQAALAQAYQLKRAYPEAERHYLRSLELSGNDPRYQNNLASLYLNMEEWDRAIDYFGRAVGNLLFMRTEVALTGMGYAHFRKGDFTAAVNAYREARVIAPRYAPVAMRLGEVFYALEQDAPAREELQRAIEQSPNYTEAYYRLGLVLLRQKEQHAAAAQFRQAVKLSPESEWGQKSAGLLKTLP